MKAEDDKLTISYELLATLDTTLQLTAIISEGLELCLLSCFNDVNNFQSTE